MVRTAWLCAVASALVMIGLLPAGRAADLDPNAYPADARKLLDEVVQAYQNLKTYGDEGSILIKATFAPADAEAKPDSQTQTHRRTVAFVRPDKLVIVTNSDLLVIDGQKATMALMRQGVYSVAPAPKKLAPKEIAAIPGPGVSGARLLAGEAGLPTALLLDLLSNPDAAKTVLEGTKGMKIEGQKERHGEEFVALLIDQSQGPDLRLFVDPKTKLIQAVELVYNLDEVNAKMPANKKFQNVSIVWDAGSVNKRPVGANFNLNLPDQFKEVEAGTGKPIEKKPKDVAKKEADDEPEKNAVDELVDKPAPDFSMVVYTAGGQTKKVTKAELAGKVVVIDFWATWCAPCLKELPEIQKLVERLASEKKNVAVVALSEDAEPDNLADRRKKIESTLSEKKIKLGDGSTSLVALDSDGKIGTDYKVESLPTLVIIDPKGTVRAAHVGYSDDVVDVLWSEINAVLEGKPLPKSAAASAEPKKDQP